MSAGKMTERVVFEAQTMVNPDAPADYGNTVSVWAPMFERRAEYIHLRGGETVMAGRLEGRHIQIIRVWSDAQTRAITTDQRARDARTGDEFNIRDVTHDVGRTIIDLLCERGEAAS